MKCPLKLVTFGSPKVGNKAFAGLFEDKVRNHFRMVMKHDAVPRLISQSKALSGYHHVSKKILLPEDISIPKTISEKITRKMTIKAIVENYNVCFNKRI